MNVNNILEIFYVLIGLIMIFASIESFRDKDNSARFGTGLFWLIMGVIFAVGKYLPNLVFGLLLVLVGILSLFKQIKVGKLKEVNKEVAEKSAKRLGAWLFFPSVVLA